MIPRIARCWLIAALALVGAPSAPLRAMAAPPAPAPVIDLCRCSRTVLERDIDGGPIPRTTIRDVTEAGDPLTFPRDTCPIGGRLEVKWHAEPPGAVRWRYNLQEPDWVSVPAGVRGVTYENLAFSVGHPDTIWPGQGTHQTFALQAIGPQGSVRETTRSFVLNFPPDSWFSGPDPSSPSLLTKPNGERFALLVNGVPPAISGSLLSPDSTLVMPSRRVDRRTFFEIWDDTVFVRQEGDTVHMGSWLLFHGGGFDRDSEYRVRVTPEGQQLPGFPGGPVLTPGPANGSPSGFRHQVMMSLTPLGRPSITGVSNLYPVFDPNDVFHQPRIGGYSPAFQAGRAFAVFYAVDGDGAQDRRIENPRDLVLRIENGTATPYEMTLGSKVLTYEVDRAPWFVTDSPVFRPRHLESFSTVDWALNLIALIPIPSPPARRLEARGDRQRWCARFGCQGRTWMGTTSSAVMAPLPMRAPRFACPGPCPQDPASSRSSCAIAPAAKHFRAADAV